MFGDWLIGNTVFLVKCSICRITEVQFANVALDGSGQDLDIHFNTTVPEVTVQGNRFKFQKGHLIVRYRDLPGHLKILGS